MKRIVAVIPARYESTRFPGKPLAMIAGKTMIQRVYEAVKAVEEFCDVIIATDDERIAEAAEQFGGHVVMTGECNCGTERVYQAIQNQDVDIVINIQGDEPLIKREMIEDLLQAFCDESVEMATLKKKIEKVEEVVASNVVKVVTDKNFDAIYFSRLPIPFSREGMEVTHYKHIGVYGYTKAFLETYMLLPESDLEKIEKLEQLRVIENGYKIRVLETKYETLGVDLPEQVREVERILLNV